MHWQIAVVLARILADHGYEAPLVDEDEVLLIQRHNVAIGCTPSDGGIVSDAAMDSGVDAGASTDAGAPPDAGPPNGGSGTCIEGDAITLVVQPRFSASTMPTKFALLYVTPSRPIVETTSDVFTSLHDLTAPRHVRQEVEVPDPAYGRVCRDTTGCGGGGPEPSGGCTDDSYSWDPPVPTGSDTTDGGVVVETVGPYEVLRVQPTSRDQLTQWLDQVGFDYDTYDVNALTPYIMRGYHVVAVRVAPTAPSATLQPLAMTWAGTELRIPAALSPSPSTLTAYISADGTYAFPSANIRFSDVTGTTYVTRNEIVLPGSVSPDDDPIAARQADLHFRETITDVVKVHVPVEVDCDDSNSLGCCSDCNANRRVRLDMIILALAVMAIIRRRR